MDPNVLATLLIIAVVASWGGEPATGGFVIPATEADVTLLARIIEIEARGEPYIGKVAVGAVVVNRVKDPRFPNTIRDVIYERNQFSSVPKLPQFPVPSEESRRAAIAALRGEDPTNGALFFYNPDLAVTNAWWASRPNRMRIGNHVFTK